MKKNKRTWLMRGFGVLMVALMAVPIIFPVIQSVSHYNHTQAQEKTVQDSEAGAKEANPDVVK